VILASILATNALNILMRHGEATRVTSLIYLTPIIAVALEYPTFGVVPSATSIAGIVVMRGRVHGRLERPHPGRRRMIRRREA
jgi:drug/metabolite transporter (DMT)-like permease